MSGSADLVLVNARVITLDPRRPRASAVAMGDGRILAVGSEAELRDLVGPATEVVDAGGGVAVPAFHDAHMHLLSFARSLFALDCRGVRSLAELRATLAERARVLPHGAWIHAWGYDEARLEEGRHPDRHDLDAAAPEHPVRVQHRSLHLDILSTRALRQARLLDASGAGIEREPAGGLPSGRLYHAAELLRRHLERRSFEEVAREVRAASRRLLALGVTSVQDAGFTNGVEEWDLFHRLAREGDLQVRAFFFPGRREWREVIARCEESGAGALVRLGPVKLMLDEATTDPAEVREAVAEVHGTGRPVALHAVSEAEVAIALEALRSSPGGALGSPDRIEHAAVLPEVWLEELRAVGVTVVGQPALVHERGDVYRAEYPAEIHGWLHRARSLLAAGVPYAAGSDAPVADPAPGLGLFAARRRWTRSGARLGAREALGPLQGLRAFTLGPAEAVGAGRELGLLRPGWLADLAVLDPAVLEAASPEQASRPTRLTIMEGRVVWRSPGSAYGLARP